MTNNDLLLGPKLCIQTYYSEHVFKVIKKSPMFFNVMFLHFSFVKKASLRTENVMRNINITCINVTIKYKCCEGHSANKS